MFLPSRKKKKLETPVSSGGGFGAKKRLQEPRDAGTTMGACLRIPIVISASQGFLGAFIHSKPSATRDISFSLREKFCFSANSGSNDLAQETTHNSSSAFAILAIVNVPMNFLMEWTNAKATVPRARFPKARLA